MFCQKCGQAVTEHAAFCSNCGQVVDAAARAGGVSGAAGAAGGASAASGAGAASAVGGAAAASGTGAIPGAARGAGAVPGAGGVPGATPGTASGSTTWPDGSGVASSLIPRVKNILLTPKTEWPVIEPEPTTVAQLYTSYVVPLAALAAVMSFVRMSVVGISMPFGGVFRTPFVSGLTLALTSFVFGLIGLFLVGLIINALAPRFAGVSDKRQAMKTAAYAFTPAWLSSVLGLLPAFATLLEFAAGLYGIYLLYLGLPTMMRSAREKAGSYTAAVVVCTIVVGILFGILSAVAGRFGYSGLGTRDYSGLTREERSAQASAAVGSMIGGVLGTDAKGKADLSAAVSNLAAAGQKIEQEQEAAVPPTPAATVVDPAAAADAAATQNAVTATAGLLSALGGAMGGSRRVEPVDFHDLKALLPAALPGLTRTGAEGSSQQTLGVKGSTATAKYSGAAGERVEIKIADISGVSGLLDAAGSMVQGVSSESDTGYEKDATIGGRTVHEKYDNQSKHGELNVIVAKRFAVSVEGDKLDMNSLERFLGGIDLAKLDGMKDANLVSR